MDPISIASLIEGSVSLAVQCGSVAKSLNSIAGNYKYAKLTISTMVQNLDIIQLAWNRIGMWSKSYSSNEDPEGEDFILRLEIFLETGKLVMDTLEEELLAYDVNHLGFKQRSKLVWNEDILQSHQGAAFEIKHHLCLYFCRQFSCRCRSFLPLVPIHTQNLPFRPS